MPASTKGGPKFSAEEFRALTTKQRASATAAIRKARDRGSSGNELREEFGSWLTGPVRCRLFREFGYETSIAKSYDGYRDGETRKGSGHARTHGVRAAQAVEEAKVAKRDAAKAKRAATKAAKLAKAATA